MRSTQKYDLHVKASAPVYSLLAIAVRTSGPEDRFPVFSGGSTRSYKRGVIDLVGKEIRWPGIVICLIESKHKSCQLPLWFVKPVNGSQQSKINRQISSVPPLLIFQLYFA